VCATRRRRVERLVLRLLVEAEAGENARGPRRRAMGIDDVQPLVNLADAVRIGGVLDLIEQARSLCRRGEHGGKRSPLPARCFLGDIADTHSRRHFDRSIVGLIDPGNQLQQSRFASAVATDQANATHRRQRS